MVRENGQAQLLPLVDSGGPHSHGGRGPRTARTLPAIRRHAVLLLVFAALPAARGRRRLRLAQAPSCFPKEERLAFWRQPSVFLEEAQISKLCQLPVSAMPAVASATMKTAAST